MPFLSPASGRVSVVRGLSEEAVAVLFACASRTSEGFRVMVERLLRAGDVDPPPPLPQGGAPSDRARAFHEAWLRG